MQRDACGAKTLKARAPPPLPVAAATSRATAGASVLLAALCTAPRARGHAVQRLPRQRQPLEGADVGIQQALACALERALDACTRSVGAGWGSARAGLNARAVLAQQRPCGSLARPAAAPPMRACASRMRPAP